MLKPDFRPYVPPSGKSKASGISSHEHAARLQTVERIKSIFGNWKMLLQEPFKGMTTDGDIIPNLYSLEPDGAPVEPAVKAAATLIGLLSPQEKARACFDVKSEQWRNWQNTEIYVEEHGLRLDEIQEPQRDAVMDVVRRSLSPRGYEKTSEVMRLNRVLGDLVDSPSVMNEWSYLFCLFGTPSLASPWGWQLFGHHLALNCLFVGGQMVLSPTFMGAEPTWADEGPFRGLNAFQDEERKGLEFMLSLSDTQQSLALISDSMMGGDLPNDRRQLADGLHLGGAYQDNRIIPYEGLSGNNLSRPQQNSLLDLVQEYMITLPPSPRSARMGDIERHLSDTHFCWIGSRLENQPFYYRIQSPVILIEFDHHAGVYLTNTEPANFHVHTLTRTPNGNDYGIDLIRQHYETAEHHRHDRA